MTARKHLSVRFPPPGQGRRRKTVRQCLTLRQNPQTPTAKPVTQIGADGPFYETMAIGVVIYSIGIYLETILPTRNLGFPCLYVTRIGKEFERFLLNSNTTYKYFVSE